jgi:hypothetical protein
VGARRFAALSSHGLTGFAEDEHEDAAEDDAAVLEEDLSDEEADSAGPVKWVVPVWEVLAADRGGRRAGLRD